MIAFFIRRLVSSSSTAAVLGVVRAAEAEEHDRERVAVDRLVGLVIVEARQHRARNDDEIDAAPREDLVPTGESMPCGPLAGEVGTEVGHAAVGRGLEAGASFQPR